MRSRPCGLIFQMSDHGPVYVVNTEGSSLLYDKFHWHGVSGFACYSCTHVHMSCKRGTALLLCI